MLYLVDGHNLIGNSRSIRLTDPDDEARLLSALHRWVLRNPRHRVMVVFDNGVYGASSPRYERVESIWARSPQDADTRLKQLLARAQATQTRLVSSDREIADAARAQGIAVIRSSDFAAELEAPAQPGTRASRRRQRPEQKLPRDEVDYWMAEFGQSDKL